MKKTTIWRAAKSKSHEMYVIPTSRESLIIHQDSYVKLALLVLNKFRQLCRGIVTLPSFSALF